MKILFGQVNGSDIDGRVGVKVGLAVGNPFRVSWVHTGEASFALPPHPAMGQRLMESPIADVIVDVKHCLWHLFSLIKMSGYEETNFIIKQFES